MIKLRESTSEDCRVIAQLHAKSWQTAYRGILSDHYLDKTIEQERLSSWEERFANPNPERHIIVAEQNGELIGFSCILLDNDPQWGTLLDNLHVHPDLKRIGIGQQLIRASAEYAHRKATHPYFHLWVWEANLNARRFYEKMGGVVKEQTLSTAPDKTQATVLRFVWDDVLTLANHRI